MPAGGLAPPSDEAEDAVSSTGRGAVFVLENAGLETAKVGKVRCFGCNVPLAQLVKPRVIHMSLIVTSVRAGA